MAASFVHQCFGEDLLLLVDDSLKQLINEYKDYYDIGLQGPDLFFYYHPLKKSLIRDYGSYLHHQEAYRFFEEMYQSIKENHDQAGYVYMIGFILHFMLDSTLHPYINRVVKEEGVSHFGIERELELYFFKERHCKVKAPASYFKNSTSKTIGYYLHIEEKIINEVLNQFKYYNHFLYHPSLRVRQCGHMLLNSLHIPFGNMFILDKYDKSLDTYLKTCLKLYPQAIQEARDVIELLNNNQLSSRLKRDYE